MGNWIGLVYQVTHAERSLPFMDGVGRDDPLALARGRRDAPDLNGSARRSPVDRQAGLGSVRQGWP